MAQQSVQEKDEKWKPGMKCDLFNREQLKWEEAEVIETFTDEKGKWVKVQCGQKTRNVVTVDPDLRVRVHIQSAEMQKLQDVAVQNPSVAPILRRILPTSTGQGVYVYTLDDSLVASHLLISCRFSRAFLAIA